MTCTEEVLPHCCVGEGVRAGLRGEDRHAVTVILQGRNTKVSDQESVCGGGEVGSDCRHSGYFEASASKTGCRM